MKIKALVPFSTGTISMEQYEVKEVTDTIGEHLIAAGVAVEIGGGSGGGVLVVTATAGTLDKTWQEIYDAAPAVIGMMNNDGKKVVMYLENVYESEGSYIVTVGVLGGTKKVEDAHFIASSADGYPTLA